MRHLVLFARWPEPGKVKTRLSPALPAELACELYQAMLRDTLEVGRSAAADRRYLYWADAPPDQPWSQAAREAGYRESLQRGRDLGARLEAAFEELLHRPDEHVVAIGADAPELTPATIDGAFARLAASDLVLGPTIDGGVYLMGLRRHAPDIFRDIPWSSDQVLARIRERATAAGLAATLLDPLSDVDTPPDLVALALRCVERGAAVAPRHTGKLLESWGWVPGLKG